MGRPKPYPTAKGCESNRHAKPPPGWSAVGAGRKRALLAVRQSRGSVADEQRVTHPQATASPTRGAVRSNGSREIAEANRPSPAPDGRRKKSIRYFREMTYGLKSGREGRLGTAFALTRAPGAGRGPASTAPDGDNAHARSLSRPGPPAESQAADGHGPTVPRRPVGRKPTRRNPLGLPRQLSPRGTSRLSSRPAPLQQPAQPPTPTPVRSRMKRFQVVPEPRRCVAARALPLT
jgi:hypothetical protein